MSRKSICNIRGEVKDMLLWVAFCEGEFPLATTFFETLSATEKSCFIWKPFNAHFFIHVCFNKSLMERYISHFIAIIQILVSIISDE